MIIFQHTSPEYLILARHLLGSAALQAYHPQPQIRNSCLGYRTIDEQESVLYETWYLIWL
jgi:hypothetical protein